MPDFAYTARDLRGKPVAGVISASSEREAMAQLTGQDLFPLEVKPDTPPVSFNFFSGVSGQQLAVFFGQLAALLRSGVPLLRSLAVLRDQTTGGAFKPILADVYTRVEEGLTLADAMDRHRAIFGEMAVNMIRAGGEGGFLEEALERVARFTEDQEDLKSRTLGALAYPIFLAVVGFLVVTALLVFFVPSFAEMFGRLRDRGELPMLTEWLLGFSTLLQRWWAPFLLVLLFFAWRVNAWLETEDGRRTGDLLKLRTPLLGGIFESLAVARFCRVLGTMLRNGVPILKSLEISREAAGNRILSDAIAAAAENISAGQSLAVPLKASGYFPTDVVEMIAVAEESNTLDEVLINIADSLERRTGRALDLFVRLLEPIMLLVLAAIVLCVVIALLLPILKMSSTL